MILTTTSKSPTPENRKKAKTLAEMIPNSGYQPRGTRTIQRMIALARKKGYKRVVIFNKKPAIVKSIKITGDDWEWHPKTLNIKDITINTAKPKYIKCKNKFLIDFFDINSEDSDYELIKKDNKVEMNLLQSNKWPNDSEAKKTWQIKKFQKKLKKN